MELHSKTKGVIGELSVAKYLAEKSIPVFTELGDNSKVDLIAIVDNKAILIQVKSIKSKNGVVNLKFSKSGPNYKFKYKLTDFDYVALHIPDRDLILWLKNTLMLEVETITIRLDDTKNKQTKYIRNYSEYINCPFIE